MIRARIRVDGRLAAVCRRFWGRRWRPTVAVVSELAETFSWLDGGSMADGRCQAGSGRARNRARARLNWASQGQRWGRCRVRRRAEWVSRPAREKNRRRSVLVVTICAPRPMRAVQRSRLCAITWIASQAALAAKRQGCGIGAPWASWRIPAWADSHNDLGRTSGGIDRSDWQDRSSCGCPVATP